MQLYQDIRGMYVTYPGKNHNDYKDLSERLRKAFNEMKSISIRHGMIETPPQLVKISHSGKYLIAAIHDRELKVAIYDAQNDTLSRRCDYNDIVNIEEEELNKLTDRMENMAKAIEKDKPVTKDDHIAELWNKLIENPNEEIVHIEKEEAKDDVDGRISQNDTVEEIER